MFASQAVNLLIEQLVINTEKNGFSHNTMSLQQWLKSGSVKVKAPVTTIMIRQKGMFFAKLHTRSQNLNYNSLYSKGTWHAINDTYKKKLH